MTQKGKARIFLLAALAAVSLFFLLEKNFPSRLSPKSSPQSNFELVESVIELIKSDYIEEPDPDKTMKGAFRGLVNSLDPLSSYLDKESVLKYAQRKNAKLKDIGVILYKGHGFFPQVVGLVEGSPAEKRGIRIGDLISILNGRSTLMMSLLEIQLYLKDKETNPVKLKIIRGFETQEMNVERAPLFEKSFSYTQAKGTSGILSIHQLFPPCVSKIKEKILPQLRQEKKALILDLRNCYEGEIEEAQKLINLFLKEPEIGYFEKKGGEKEILSSPDTAELGDLPLIIWTNQATMGNAELVAGVLKEFKKTKIVGLPTPGLVAKQDFFALKGGSGLLLTSGIFYLKSGTPQWKTGVNPDIDIGSEDQGLSSYLKKSLSSQL